MLPERPDAVRRRRRALEQWRSAGTTSAGSATPGTGRSSSRACTPPTMRAGRWMRAPSAIVVSNHGGRQLDGVAPTLRVLPEVVAAVGGRVEVLLDGGIRRGSDIVKALASARAPCSSAAPTPTASAPPAGRRGTRDRDPARRSAHGRSSCWDADRSRSWIARFWSCLTAGRPRHGDIHHALVKDEHSHRAADGQAETDHHGSRGKRHPHLRRPDVRRRRPPLRAETESSSCSGLESPKSGSPGVIGKPLSSASNASENVVR